MKSEKQVTDRLEEVVVQLQAAAAKLDAVPEAEVTLDQKAEIVTLIACLSTLGWVLDCEEELRGLFRNLRIADAANKLTGKV